MKVDLQIIHEVWRRKIPGSQARAGVDLEKLINTIAVGPCYVFVLDLTNTKVSHLSKTFQQIHGIEISTIEKVDDIIHLIHPDDLPFVVKAEEQYRQFDDLGTEKIVNYKTSYNFRMRVGSGAYQLFNHQALVLETDEDGHLLNALNIHTNINHITSANNYKISLIGLGDYPSYLDIDISGSQLTRLAQLSPEQIFSRRELMIFELLQQGLTSKEIAEKLFVSPDTIKTHRKNILKKAGCSRTTELISKFFV